MLRGLVVLLLTQFILATRWAWAGLAEKGATSMASVTVTSLSFTVWNEAFTIGVESDVLVMELKPAPQVMGQIRVTRNGRRK